MNFYLKKKIGQREREIERERSSMIVD